MSQASGLRLNTQWHISNCNILVDFCGGRTTGVPEKTLRGGRRLCRPLCQPDSLSLKASRARGQIQLEMGS